MRFGSLVHSHVPLQACVSLEAQGALPALVVTPVCVSVQVVRLQCFGSMESRPAEFTDKVSPGEVQCQVALQVVLLAAGVVTVGATVWLVVSVIVKVTHQGLLSETDNGNMAVQICTLLSRKQQNRKQLPISSCKFLMISEEFFQT